MPAISRTQAVDRLRHEIQTMRWDDLAEVYNELFPQHPITEDAARRNPEGIRDQITKHVDLGLEIEEIESLWHIVFAKERIDYYDEETNTFHLRDRAEATW